ncbi:esterase-like activity of phytase family protein [Saccharopolyspora endophytica]|nr:esterase-like activity of phytase family protein [Saccharopolyspora endophytica]
MNRLAAASVSAALVAALVTSGAALARDEGDAVELYRTDLPPLATIDGVEISGGAYGSSLFPVPGSPDEYYGITDRGPNVDGPNDVKVEPIPDFTPAIGRFKLVDGKAELESTIPLRAADGTPYSGRLNSEASTGETIVDRDGKPLDPDPNGYDPEGLVALPDGTFWISDEYGPFITRFGADGRAIERVSPFNGGLPAELAHRAPNQGMEGLTITPDGRTLVGMMQSALQQPDLTVEQDEVTVTRIVTYDLATRATHEHVYLLDDPKDNEGAVSEITALSSTEFVVDERDGDLGPGAHKKLFKIDLTGATDVQGRDVDGKSIEAHVGAKSTADAKKALDEAGIKPVSKDLFLDLDALITETGVFNHDKIEGVAVRDGGRTIVISNDSDFGIDGVTNDTPPYQLKPKTLPDGTQDDGEFLKIDMTKLND